MLALIADVVMGDAVLPDAALIVADLDPTAPKGDDEAAVEDFTMVPRGQVETDAVAGSTPQLAGGSDVVAKSAVAEPTKDNILGVVAATLPGPHQAVLGALRHSQAR